MQKEGRRQDADGQYPLNVSAEGIGEACDDDEESLSQRHEGFPENELLAIGTVQESTGFAHPAVRFTILRFGVDQSECHGHWKTHGEKSDQWPPKSPSYGCVGSFIAFYGRIYGPIDRIILQNRGGIRRVCTGSLDTNARQNTNCRFGCGLVGDVGDDQEAEEKSLGEVAPRLCQVERGARPENNEEGRDDQRDSDEQRCPEDGTGNAHICRQQTVDGKTDAAQRGTSHEICRDGGGRSDGGCIVAYRRRQRA